MSRAIESVEARIRQYEANEERLWAALHDVDVMLAHLANLLRAQSGSESP